MPSLSVVLAFVELVLLFAGWSALVLRAAVLWRRHLRRRRRAAAELVLRDRRRAGLALVEGFGDARQAYVENLRSLELVH